ncbi:MAG: tyrosine recombinase XerC [Clostridia bacterium]|nr:tyrosine recombinase XerC [Clostridia bacterium]
MVLDHSEFLQLPDIVKSYVSYTETVKGRSVHTVDEYVSDLRLFFRYLKVYRGIVPADTPLDEIPIHDIDVAFLRDVTLNEVYEFLVYCKNDRENNAKTRARKSSSLRSFFKYLTVKCQVLDVNPLDQLDSPKTKRSLPKYLTLEQSIELLNSVDGDYRERDYCILTLFLNCGLRLSELCGLNVTDIHTDRSMRVLGKGNKERIVYLNDACMEAVNNYLRVRPVDEVPAEHKKALFLSRLKRRISPKTVQHIVYHYLEKIGLDGQGYSVHKLRHTAATLMYQHGNVDIRVLKDILGHADLGTTQIYTHLSDTQIREAVESSPLANVKQKKQKQNEANDE